MRGADQGDEGDVEKARLQIPERNMGPNRIVFLSSIKATQERGGRLPSSKRLLTRRTSAYVSSAADPLVLIARSRLPPPAGESHE